MTNFTEANQARLSLKMMLSNYSWYNGSIISTENNDFIIIVHVSRLDNNVRKVVPIVHNGVSVKVDISS